MKVSFKACLVVACLLAPRAFAADDSSVPTIRFTFDFPKSNPEHYEITVQENGHDTYTSTGDLGSGATPDATRIEFSISEQTRQELFDLVKKAHYFSGKVDSGNTRIANTGTKTLIYRDSAHNNTATYNYSTDIAVQQVTSVLQGLSSVLEYGRRLTWFRKYQKLALEDDLKQMEEQQKTNNLGDVDAIAPILKQIADDPAVMRMTRARAMRLLLLVKK